MMRRTIFKIVDFTEYEYYNNSLARSEIRNVYNLKRFRIVGLNIESAKAHLGVESCGEQEQQQQQQQQQQQKCFQNSIYLDTREL